MVTVAMASTPRKKTAKKSKNEPLGRPRLWPMVAGDHQLAGVHHLRLQLCQTPIAARLAFIRRVLGVSSSALYRDVWFPADNLPVFRLAVAAISGCGFLFARCRTPAGSDVRLEEQPAFRTIS